MFTAISLHRGDDDQARHLRGRVVCEIDELRGLSTRDLEGVKSFITRREESLVPKYQERRITFPRRCLLIGTTNEERFLDDPTGERRWLPIKVTRGDRDAIVRDREQLWSEAVAIYELCGIAWQDAERLARNEHANFTVHDGWQDAIANFAAGAETIDGVKREPSFTMHEVMTIALGKSAGGYSVQDQRRAGRILQRLGYAQRRFRPDGRAGRQETRWAK